MACRLGFGVVQLCGGLNKTAAMFQANIVAGGLKNQCHHQQQQRRTIVTKWMLKLPDNYPDPWPYKEKGFGNYMLYFDYTKPRFHENSKLIVVEGNLACGKSAFAAELADELGFHHMPEFRMDEILVDRYGIDMRDYYHLFPKCFRVPDINMFYRNPAEDETAVMQDRIFECRWEQYLNALAHIFNTGQGVVLERTPHSDFVFANAMRQKDWISPEYYNFYFYKRKVALPQLMLWPHLVIYLDLPPEQCLENIRKRGNPDETKTVDLQYLTTIADSYKDYLREMRAHSYILSYDWSEPEPMEEVLEDIKEFNFDFYEWHHGDELYEWFTIRNEHRFSILRHQFTHKAYLQHRAFDELKRLHHEISELYIYPHDGIHFRNVVMHEIYKDRCTPGWTHRDPIQGIWKTDTVNWEVPEDWVEYYWKESYHGMAMHAERYFNPTGRNYNPEYLLGHH